MDTNAYISENELFSISEITGKPVDEVMKDRIRMRKEIADWHLAHAEFGDLVTVEKTEGSYGGTSVKVSWVPRLSSSSEIKTARSCFIPKSEAQNLYDKCMNLKGKRCVFFISSSTKMSRFLLDIERFEEID